MNPICQKLNIAKQTSIHSGISLLFFWFSIKIGWFIQYTVLFSNFTPKIGGIPPFFTKNTPQKCPLPLKIPPTGDRQNQKNFVNYGCKAREDSRKKRKKLKGYPFMLVLCTNIKGYPFNFFLFFRESSRALHP